MKRAIFIFVVTLMALPMWLSSSSPGHAQRGYANMDCDSSGCRPWPRGYRDRGYRGRGYDAYGRGSRLDCDSSGCRPWPRYRNHRYRY